ncbi:uncharacterized protein [Periplaneta americana]|uniref:uncharacterized protein n=1 Tax=Periplaneta americana TaxID=6978 RepID=UPI0037E80257
MFQQRSPGSAMSANQDDMYGQRKMIPTIYNPNEAIQSREMLAINGFSNVPSGSNRSLPVVREQYCMCTPTTRLEKRLTMAVVVLIVVVVILLVGISILADRLTDGDLKNVVKTLTRKL